MLLHEVAQEITQQIRAVFSEVVLHGLHFSISFQRWAPEPFTPTLLDLFSRGDLPQIRLIESRFQGTCAVT